MAASSSQMAQPLIDELEKSLEGLGDLMSDAHDDITIRLRAYANDADELSHFYVGALDAVWLRRFSLAMRDAAAALHFSIENSPDWHIVSS